MCIDRKIRIVKYWLKLYSNENGNIIPRVIYHQMVDDMDKGDTSWAFKVKRFIGFPEVWMFPGSVVINSFIPMLRIRLTILILQTGEKEWRHVPPFPCLDRLNKYANLHHI